jgi:hypothetical protein
VSIHGTPLPLPQHRTGHSHGNQRDYTTGGVTDWDALMQGVFQHLDAAMRPEGQVLVGAAPNSTGQAAQP